MFKNAQQHAAGFAAWLALAIGLAGVPGGKPAAGQPAARAEVGDEFWFHPERIASVRGALGAPSQKLAPSTDAVADKVATLGAPAVPIVVAMLAGELEPFDPDGPEAARTTPDELRRRELALRASLARFGSDEVLACLRARAAAGLDGALVAADLLGLVSAPSATDELLTIFASMDAVHLGRGVVSATFERSIASQIESSPGTVDRLSRFGRAAAPCQLQVMARAVARVRSTRAAELMVAWLGHDLDTDLALLSALGKVAERGLVALPEDRAAQVRLLLGSTEPALCMAAISVVGQARDARAFEDLLELWNESTPEVQARTLRWSLERIAGARAGTTRASWVEWKAREDAWWREAAPGLLERLTGDDDSASYDALLELCEHPVRRDELADAIGPLLQHENSGLADAACRQLSRLASARCVPWLVDAMANVSPERREVLAGALRALTGLDLPAAPGMWVAALGH